MRTAIVFGIGWTLLAFAATVEAQDVHKSRYHGYRVETPFNDLNNPWGLAFLPDGRMLVTEQAGRLNLLNPADGSRVRIEGVPQVAAVGQGGLLDVALHPQFDSNRFVYLSYTVAGEGGYATQVGRGRLDGDRLLDFEPLFTATPFTPEHMNFGSRLAFDRDGFLFITVGDRTQRDRAQQLDGYRGSVVRLADDGGVPSDNPFNGRDGSLPGIWTFGHRNPQGLALHPGTGDLWLNEHGPRGGDGLHILKAGSNYGWPKVTFGQEYSGGPIGAEPPVPGFQPPIHHWTPSIAPSGMAFYQGDAFERWKGDLFIGALVQRKLVRLRIDGGRVVEEEDLLTDLGWRIRGVWVGPDGYLYVLPDDWGAPLMRLLPTKG